MKFSRRDVLKATGASALGSALVMIGVTPAQAKALKAGPIKTLDARETSTVCPYCAVGCGLIVSTRDGEIVNIEGDPDHPINEGSLCSKGMSLYQVAVNDRRLTKVRYRAPGSDHFEEKSWEWAMEKIAQKVKETRDATFVAKEPDGMLVNRTDGIACLGGAALDNEECYLYSKLARAMGVTYLEHQARI